VGVPQSTRRRQIPGVVVGREIRNHVRHARIARFERGVDPVGVREEGRRAIAESACELAIGLGCALAQPNGASSQCIGDHREEVERVDRARRLAGRAFDRAPELGGPGEPIAPPSSEDIVLLPPTSSRFAHASPYVIAETRIETTPERTRRSPRNNTQRSAFECTPRSAYS
jgi:hypothetical protein